MNKKLRIAFLSLIAFFCMEGIYAQTENLFYASVEDYKNEKPIEGYSIVDNSYSSVFGSAWMKIIKDGVEEKKKIKDLPSIYFTYNKWFIRVCDNTLYIVLVEGPLCYYAKYFYNSDQYFSETITGELNGFSERALTKYLKQYNLLDSFEKDNPKRKFKDNVNDYFNKRVEWYKKYFVLLNEKMEAK